MPQDDGSGVQVQRIVDGGPTSAYRVSEYTANATPRIDLPSKFSLSAQFGLQDHLSFVRGTGAYGGGPWQVLTYTGDVLLDQLTLQQARRQSSLTGGALGFGVGLLVGGLVGVMIMKKR